VADEREAMLMRVRDMRDLAFRSRRAARGVPTQWAVDTLNAYAQELDEQADELERRADGNDT